LNKDIKRARYINYLPNNIYYLRTKKKLSQEGLAEMLGYTNKTISGWEVGRRTPDPFDLQDLCKIFNVSMDDLIATDLEMEYLEIKKYTKKEVKEKVTNIVTNSELEENKKQTTINFIEMVCEENE
jgi:transcriptional regulator with XRE-family HTH domain